jgi:hypothetical protein
MIGLLPQTSQMQRPALRGPSLDTRDAVIASTPVMAAVADVTRP